MTALLGFLRRPPRSGRSLMPATGFDCYTVTTPSGAFLAVGPGQGGRTPQIVLGQDEPAEGRVLLCTPETDRRFGFLIAQGAGSIRLSGASLEGAAMPLRIERRGMDDPVRLLHPLDASYRLKAEMRPKAEALEVRFLPGAGGQRHDFLLQRVEAGALPAAVSRVCEEMAGAIGVLPRWEIVVSALREGRLRPALAEAALCCLPRDEIQALAEELVVSAETRRLLRACMRGDVWIGARLDALIAWRQNRDRPQPAILAMGAGEFSDLPGALRSTAHTPKLGLCLVAAARLRVRPTRMACVVASARNEGPYLLDWIAHHRALGFDHVFLYTNDNTDGSDALLDALGRAGVVTWVKNHLPPETLPQFRAYAHALSVLPEILDYRWTLIADLDEYFGFEARRFSGVADFLAWHEMAGSEAIALPWLLHVAGAEDRWDDVPCTERFPWREETVNHHVKTLFRTNAFWSSNPHHPDPSLGMPFNFRGENSVIHMPKAPENSFSLAEDPKATHAWIAHYIFKSTPEALMKVMRGKGDMVRAERQVDFHQVMAPFVALSQKRKLVEDRRTQVCGRNFAVERARLLGLPGVSVADAAIRESYAVRIHDVCLDYIRQGPIAGESAECAAFRAILLRQRHDLLFAGKIVA